MRNCCMQCQGTAFIETVALRSNANRHSSLFTPRALVPAVGRTLHSSLFSQGEK